MNIGTYMTLLTGLYREFIRSNYDVDKAINIYISKSSIHERNLPPKSREFMKNSILKIYEEVKNENQEPSDARIWGIGEKLFKEASNN